MRRRAPRAQNSAVEISSLKTSILPRLIISVILKPYRHIDPMKIAHVSKRQKYIGRIYELDNQYAVTQKQLTERFYQRRDETLNRVFMWILSAANSLFASMRNMIPAADGPLTQADHPRDPRAR